jgi:hypothetical protein
MKNWMLGLSIVAVVLCGFLLLEKDNEAARARARAAAAEKQREDLAAEVEHQGSRATKLQTQLRETRARAVEHALENETLKQQLAGASPRERKQKNPLLRDPKLRAAMQAEAEEGVEKNIKELFSAGLAEQLQLNDTQSAALAQLLTQKANLFWQKMLFPMMTGEIEEADMAAAGQTLRKAADENKAQLRALLGDSGLSTYEWFEKTEGARDEYKQLSTRLARDGQQLTEDQQSQLRNLLNEEHASLKMHYDFGDPSQLDLEHWYDNFTDEKLEICGQDLEQLNDRIVQRSQSVLTPDQTAALKDLLAQRSLKARFVVMTTTAMLARQR